MDYEKLLRMKEQLKEQRETLPKEALESLMLNTRTTRLPSRAIH